MIYGKKTCFECTGLGVQSISWINQVSRYSQSFLPSQMRTSEGWEHSHFASGSALSNVYESEDKADGVVDDSSDGTKLNEWAYWSLGCDT